MRTRHSILRFTSLMLMVALAIPSTLFAQSDSTAVDPVKKRKAQEVFTHGIFDNCSNHSIGYEGGMFAMWSTIAYISTYIAANDRRSIKAKRR